MICLIKCSMKKIFSILIFTLCLLYCIFRPRQMALAAASGLSIWYHSVLPTLLPFSILSGIMVCSGIYDSLSERIHPWFSKVYPVRAPLIYPLIAGFLFGFPLGSKICADLYDADKITAKEAEIISCISNNFKQCTCFIVKVAYWIYPCRDIIRQQTEGMYLKFLRLGNCK